VVHLHAMQPNLGSLAHLFQFQVLVLQPPLLIVLGTFIVGKHAIHISNWCAYVKNVVVLMK
jgi:hypothetical protein